MTIAPDDMICVQSSAKPGVSLRIRDLGRMAYAPALELQKDIQQQVIAAREGDSPLMELLLVEHDPPVITVSRRPGARLHLLATEKQLKHAGVEVAETDRGGDITYHGPGQLVVYPILDLNMLGLRLVSYLRFLEDVVIKTLAQFNMQAMRDPTATGVWVATRNGHDVASTSKICAIGVRVSRWVSMHGLALNVTTNLDHFNLIVPCGLAGRTVTSMQRELANACPDMNSAKRAIVEEFQRAIARSCIIDSA
jgi:lipoyl(octanoyl) transferase